MAKQDWLVGADRRTEAVERILSAASDFFSRNGFKAFIIDALSTKLNCSPTTIYRHAGGKALAAQWLIRVTFSLWYWPLKDKQTERALVTRFAGPSVTQGLSKSH